MTAFPRTILPSGVTELELPGPLISKAQSGRVNIRATQQAGHTWKERYLLKVTSATDRAFLATVRNLWRNGTVFDISHVDYQTPKGTGGGSPLINNASQLVSQPENFGAWSVGGGTPTLASGQTDPLGGTAAYLLTDDNAGATEWVYLTVTFTGDGTKCFSVYLRASTAASTTVDLFDDTAGTALLKMKATWSGGTPTLSMTGSGTLYLPEDAGGAWWRCSAAVNSVVAAHTNKLRIFGTQDVPGDTGATYYFGANAWNEVSPAKYVGPSSTNTEAIGSSLYLNGGTASTNGWLQAGDLLAIAGVRQVVEVTATLNTQANGYVIAAINPPLFTGGGPADNAVVTISGVTMRAVILEPPIFPDTTGIGADYGELTISFSEVL